MSEKVVKKYTLAQVRENADTKKPWIVINDSVYDVTEFLNDVRSSRFRYSWFTFNSLVVCFISFHSTQVARRSCWNSPVKTRLKISKTSDIRAMPAK